MSTTPEARERDSAAAGEYAIETGDRLVERATSARLTVLSVEHTGDTAMARIESTRPGRDPIRYRMPVRDVRGRVRRGEWLRVDR